MHFPIELFSELSRSLAYLDPGSGSFLLQLILAAILGSAVVIRTQWAKLKGLFNKNTNSYDEDLDDDIEE